MIKNAEDIKHRALTAYLRFGGPGVPQPSGEHTEAREVDGKIYVTLGNANGLLACYRVRNDGKLKKLVRVPSELEY